MSEESKEISFMVTSGFGHRERVPYVAQGVSWNS